MLFRHSYSEALLSQILGPWTSYHWRILMLTLFPLKMRSFLRLDDNTTLIIRDNVSLKVGMFLVNTPCCIVQMKEGSQKKAYKCRSSDAINICMKRRENGGIDPVVLSSRRRKDLLYFILKNFYPRLMAETRVSLFLLDQHWKLSLTQHHQIRNNPYPRVFQYLMCWRK